MSPDCTHTGIAGAGVDAGTIIIPVVVLFGITSLFPVVPPAPHADNERIIRIASVV